MPKVTNDKHCTFENEWLNLKYHPEFFWLRQSVGTNNEGYCILFKSNFSIDNVGIKGVQSRVSDKKHLGRANAHNDIEAFLISTQKSSDELVEKPADASNSNGVIQSHKVHRKAL